MRSRSNQLAEQFALASDELIAAVERCSDTQWRAICSAEGWTVGVTAHHVAADYADLLDVIDAIATGRPTPAWTRGQLDQRNAEHAREFAHCTQHETIALLRRNGTLLAAAIRGLSDDQLTRIALLLGQEVRVADIAAHLLLSHIRGHLASIRAAAEVAS